MLSAKSFTCKPASLSWQYDIPLLLGGTKYQNSLERVEAMAHLESANLRNAVGNPRVQAVGVPMS